MPALEQLNITGLLRPRGGCFGHFLAQVGGHNILRQNGFSRSHKLGPERQQVGRVRLLHVDLGGDPVPVCCEQFRVALPTEPRSNAPGGGCRVEIGNGVDVL